MTRRLYVARWVSYAVVYAENEQDAQAIAMDASRYIFRNDPGEAEIGALGTDKPPHGWDEGSLVYHPGGYDLTIAEARVRPMTLKRKPVEP